RSSPWCDGAACPWARQAAPRRARRRPRPRKHGSGSPAQPSTAVQATLLAHLTPRLRDCLNRAARAAADSGPRPSKRNLVVHVAALAGAGHGRLLLARRGAGGAEIILVGAELAAGAIPGPVEHGELRIEVLQHHLGGVLVLARLILPFARLQLALEIDLRALLQILLGHPAKPLVEDDHAVPFGLLAALAGCLVAPGIRGGHAQIGDRPAVLRAPDLGIFAEIADQDRLVHATGHDALLLVARIVRGTLIPSPGPRRRFLLRHHAFPQRRHRERLGSSVLYLF